VRCGNSIGAPAYHGALNAVWRMVSEYLKWSERSPRRPSCRKRELRAIIIRTRHLATQTAIRRSSPLNLSAIAGARGPPVLLSCCSRETFFRREHPIIRTQVGTHPLSDAKDVLRLPARRGPGFLDRGDPGPFFSFLTGDQLNLIVESSSWPVGVH
jgi:hypothetical protein